MINENKLFFCVIIISIALIASRIFGFPGQGIIALCWGASIGVCIGIHILGKIESKIELRYIDLYRVANTALSSYGKAIIFNIKTTKHDVKQWPIPTPRKEDVLSSIESDIPNFVTKFSDFKDIVYGIVAHIGSEALSKQHDGNKTYCLHMLTLMQDQAVHDCAGVWLRREGRQCLRISIDDIMHVYMEWTDVESNKEANEHADEATHT